MKPGPQVLGRALSREHILTSKSVAFLITGCRGDTPFRHLLTRKHIHRDGSRGDCAFRNVNSRAHHCIQKSAPRHHPQLCMFQCVPLSGAALSISGRGPAVPRGTVWAPPSRDANPQTRRKVISGVVDRLYLSVATASYQRQEWSDPRQIPRIMFRLPPSGYFTVGAGTAYCHPMATSSSTEKVTSSPESERARIRMKIFFRRSWRVNYLNKNARHPTLIEGDILYRLIAKWVVKSF